MAAKHPIPEGLHTVTPYFTCKDTRKEIDFLKKAFGAEVRGEIMACPESNAVMHAEVKIGNSMLMLSDENPERGYLSPASRGGNTSSVMLYTDDVDAVFKKAIAAGAKANQPPTDMFWGDRMGNLTDPFGHSWAVATHKEDVSPQEMEKRMAAMA